MRLTVKACTSTRASGKQPCLDARLRIVVVLFINKIVRYSQIVLVGLATSEEIFSKKVLLFLLEIYIWLIL